MSVNCIIWSKYNSCFIVTHICYAHLIFVHLASTSVEEQIKTSCHNSKTTLTLLAPIQYTHWKDNSIQLIQIPVHLCICKVNMLKVSFTKTYIIKTFLFIVTTLSLKPSSLLLLWSVLITKQSITMSPHIIQHSTFQFSSHSHTGISNLQLTQLQIVL